jgi:hypothetical protein
MSLEELGPFGVHKRYYRIAATSYRPGLSTINTNCRGRLDLSVSVHPSRNPVDTSEDELSESEDDGVA